MTKIAGVVISYYPDYKKLRLNIESFIDNIEQLFIVFNSPVSLEDANILSSGYPNIELIYNNDNLGIATALNQTVLKAVNLGFEWLLTMDQDSFFESDQFFAAFSKNRKNNVAIFSPNPELSKVTTDEDSDIAEETLSVITSGNLVNLKIWETIGGFEETLFIDEVDNDYCLKAVLNGFKILRFKNIPLIHELGQNKEVSFLFKKYTIIIHPPIRSYYIFRNNLYIFSKYKNKFPGFVRSRKTMLLKNFIKILLFSTERVQNFHFIIKGIRDYFRNVYGPYNGKILKPVRS